MLDSVVWYTEKASISPRLRLLHRTLTQPHHSPIHSLNRARTLSRIESSIKVPLVPISCFLNKQHSACKNQLDLPAAHSELPDHPVLRRILASDMVYIDLAVPLLDLAMSVSHHEAPDTPHPYSEVGGHYPLVEQEARN